MAIRNIVKQGYPILGKVCRPVDKFDDRLAMLLDDMIETLHDSDGVGLAAPQVGILRRAVVIDTGDGPFELINPEFVLKEGEQDAVEGCLSVPGQYGYTKRPEHVVIKAQNRKGEPIEVDGKGFLATVICHETDHLNGVLFTSHAVRMLTPEELEKIK